MWKEPKEPKIPTITITGPKPIKDFSVPKDLSGGGNKFTNWTDGGNSGNFGGGSSFMPKGLVPDTHSVSSGLSSFGTAVLQNTTIFPGGGTSINSNSIGLGKEYHYTEILGTAGNKDKITGGNNSATVWYMIEFCHKKSSDCWGSNALDHEAGGADGPYHVKAINIGWCDVDDNDIANLLLRGRV